MGFTQIEHADLGALNTFGVATRARLLVEVRSSDALAAALESPKLAALPTMVLGEGSNLLLVDDYAGVMLRLMFRGCEVTHENPEGALVRAEAGVGWDGFVDWTLARGLSGLENLALIPGLVGAAPIQNIGAYGVEVGEFIETVEAFDRNAARIERLAATDCRFSYRDSRFKHEPDRWLVTAVELRLPRHRAPRTGYAGVADELLTMDVAQPTSADVAEAVRRIRRRKLPDPRVIGNAGSFFKNPVIAAGAADVLRARHPALPVFATGDPATRKLSAAWLIEACGWRGHRDGDAGVSAQHALVLVNHGRASGAELLQLARRVARSVHERFGIALEPEPRIIGARWDG